MKATRSRQARWATITVVAVLAATGTGPGAALDPAPGLVRVSAASPFAPDCGVDIRAAGFGDGFADTEAEVSLAVDPGDPAVLVAAWMQDLYQGYVTATSTDGGASWTTTPVPGTSTCSGGDYDLAADPWLSIGRDGRTYLAGFSLDLPDEGVPAPHRTRLQVSTSDDAGRSWAAPVVVAAGLGALHDKPAVTAHPTRAGTAYLVWTEESTAFGPLSSGVHLAVTGDGGRTWSEPAPLLAALPPGFIPHGAELLVLPNGTLVVVATLNPTVLPPAGEVLPHTLVATTSGDGGATWSAPVQVAGFATRGPSFASVRDPETGDPIQVPGAFASAAVGPDGMLTVAWRHATADDSAEIRIARSPDGQHWTAPRVVASGTQAFLPATGVAPDGTIGVSWYDFRDDVPGDGPLSTSVRLAQSVDGEHWEEVRLAGPFDLRAAATRRIPAEGRFLGDYHSLVGTSRGFAAAFALPAPYASAGLSDVFFTTATR